MSEQSPDELQGLLTELFNEFVDVDTLHEKSTGSTRLVVCNMSYTRRTSDDTRHRRVSQTAVAFSADNLDLPQFAMSPHARGFLGMLMSGLGGFGDINFDDSPEFSERYHLHAWAEEPVRILFTQELREHLAGAENWCVRGKGHLLVVFRANEIVPSDELDSFVSGALTVVNLFQKGEEQLDRRPDIQREATANDMMQTADRMGGLVGSLLQKQLRKRSVTEEQLEEFLNAATPRTIPRGMKVQVLGDNLPLVFIGVLFLVAGLVVGGIVFLTVDDNRWIGALFMAMFPLIGGGMAGGTLWYRNRKGRVLKHGELVSGVISQVQRTSVIVNNQVRFSVAIDYSVNGNEYSTTCNAYGPAATKAQSLRDSATSIRILVDPKDPQHVICVDLLTVFEQ